MSMTQTQAAATLGLSMNQFWSLTGNAAFPSPISNDFAGNVVWASPDITGFVTTMAQAAANGWRWSSSDLAGAPWAMMAATPCGPYARAPVFGGGAPGLFD
jgi:predicted DNA-binding transcriptional regulator AlpA